MNINKVISVTLSLVLLWSCGKGEDSETSENIAPKIEAQNFKVLENISSDTKIGPVEAIDENHDKLLFDTLDNELFEIDDSGYLSLINGKTLDYEFAKEHNVMVIVSDGKADNKASITIEVLNVDDGMSEDPNSFITKWEIPNDNFELTIGTSTVLSYNYSIDWGDGSPVENLSIKNPTHIYENSGTYFVAIQGAFPHIMMREQPLHNRKALKSIEQWGNISWESFSSAFALCQWVEYNATDAPNLDKVERMDEAFFNAISFNGDLNAWDVSKVTDMHGMFKGAEVFNGNISDWNVGNVTNMGHMFYGASSFSGDLSSWNVSNATRMDGMFYGAIQFNANIGNWNVSNVNRMDQMFAYAESFNSNIGNWNVSSVTRMDGMFLNASQFNQHIGAWKTSNVELMFKMFENASLFNSDIGNWDVANVANMSEMFLNASSFDQNVSAWDIGSVSGNSMSNMFDGTIMSRENLNATLIGWSDYVQQNNGPFGIKLGIDNLSYCGQPAIAASKTLVDDYFWELQGNFDQSPNCK